MHVHGIQSDPNFQLNYLYALARAEAGREAERTRARLQRAASSLVNECDDGEDFSVSLARRGDSHKQPNQQNRQNQSSDSQQEEQESDGPVGDSFSDYA